MNLLSDAGQSITWENSILPNLNKNQTLYFSHGFSVVYKDKTGVIPPKDMDVADLKGDIKDYFVEIK